LTMPTLVAGPTKSRVPPGPLSVRHRIDLLKSPLAAGPPAQSPVTNAGLPANVKSSAQKPKARGILGRAGASCIGDTRDTFRAVG
jgi:hypothetical protein